MIKISDRTQRSNVNAILSLFFRASSILLQFALVPLTINYIKPNIYGVWLTLSSLVGWAAIFDVGIGNGLKNKLSESLAKKEIVKAKIYVSTTYFIIGIIGLFVIFLFLLIYNWINWQRVFNSSFISEKELKNVVAIVSVFYLLKFITDIINVVSASFQMVSVSSILVFISNLGLTFSVFLLSQNSESNLILLSVCLSVIPFLISLFANIFLFKTYFKSVTPSIKFVNFKESKGIVSLGFHFFILQIINLILFQTDNILIAQMFNPAEVTNFNIGYKYYSIVLILFSIILTPYWTAFTEAYHIGDFDWIDNSMKRLYQNWVISLGILLVMFLLSSYVIKLWVGEGIIVPLNLSIALCFYVAITNWNSILGNFLNGVGKIRLQIYIAFIMGILNLPLSVILVKVFNLGTFSMPLANGLCLTFGAIICFIQYRKIISKSATGIWDK